jgi:tetratricopeptide (TPR) repeat protein
MLVKEKLSGISLYSLIPQKSVKPRILIKDEPLLSSPFIISQNRSANSRFIGRIKELDYLRTLYSEAISNLKKQRGSAGQFYKPIIAAVSGEPGIGKSRLINEFIKRIKANSANEVNTFLYGRNLSTQQQPNGMFTDIVKPGGFKTGSTVKNENNAAVNNLIKETIFKTAFEVIAFEDMQWADESSISAFEHILRSINLYTESWQPQIFFIINYRNKFKPSKTLRTEADYREIYLDGFTEKETEAFIVSLTGGKTISGKTREIIRERSDGNPFNIEEWCSLLGESKKLSRIPESIRQLLVEKVTNLLPEERSVLIIACVLGRKFDLKILRGIQKRAGKEQATLQVMQSLMDKRYLVNLSGDIYEFRHDILQETIYRQLITELKQNVHLLAGNAIEELFPNKLSDYYYELARHYTAAKNETKSTEYLEKAGDKAKDNYEHERALRYYSHLLKFITGDAKYKVTFKICDVHMNRSEWNKQIELCNGILKENRRLDKSLKAECYKRIGNCLRLKGDYKEALQIYKKAFRIYGFLKDIQGKLNIIEHEAKVMMVMGKYKDALSSFEMVYKLSKEYNYRESFKNALIGLGIVNSKIGKYDETIKYNEELKLFSMLNNEKLGIVISQTNQAEAYYYLGDHSRAKTLYLEALELSKKNEGKHEKTICLGNLGNIYFFKSEFKKAIHFFQMQLKELIIIGDKAGINIAIGAIGACFISVGNYDKALYYIKKQMLMSKQLLRKNSLAISYCNIGIVHNLKGEFLTAKMFFIKQLKINKEQNNTEGIIRAFVNIGIQYKNIKKYSIALKYLRNAFDISFKNNINTYNPLIYLNFGEIFFEKKKFRDAIKSALIAEEEAIKNCNKEIEFLAKSVIVKSQIIDIINNTVTTKSKKIEKINLLYEKYYRDIKFINKKELLAIVYFTCFQMDIILQPFGVLHLNSMRNKRNALSVYKKLYKLTPQFEYKEKIKLLNLN